MSTRPKLSKDGSIHVTDEVWNARISAFGAILAVVGSFFLVKKGLLTGNSTTIISYSIYAAALVGLFLSSALHHGVDGSERVDHFLRQVDYFAIYILIAASFTPLSVLLLKGKLGWGLLIAIWLMAVAGILLKGFYPALPKKISVVFYVIMSGLGGLMMGPLYRLNPVAPLLLLVSGVILLTGMAIYITERPNPVPGKFGFHEIWHLHVLCGVAFQFFLIFLFL